jgi:hypothetical protein
MIYDNIISLGAFCGPGLSLRKLNLKKETLPFDWIITNAEIIYDILSTNNSKFININNKLMNDENLIMKDFFFKLFNNNELYLYKNEYGIYFTHYNNFEIQELINKFTKYFDRFYNLLLSSNNILFIHSTEAYIYHKLTRDNVNENYNYLIKISELLKIKYPKLKFLILNIEINNKHIDTDNIKNINVTHNLGFSDNCEFHDPKHYDLYRNTLTKIIKKFLF